MVIPTIQKMPTIPTIPTYIICLAKTRAQRCDPTFNAWSKVSQAHALHVQRLDAVTPQDFDLKAITHPYAYSCIQRKERKTLEMIGSKVEVACALSHMKAWEKIAQSGVPGIVVEDDMAMPPRKLHGMLDQLKHMPKYTDMYLLHFIGVNFKYKALPNKFVDVLSFTGLQAYYMTPTCAKKLLSTALPIVFQVDTYVPRAKETHDLKIRTRLENRMPFLKFARDNLKSTLGKNHVSSVMLAMAIAIAVLVLVIIALSIMWAMRTAKSVKTSHDLDACSLRLKSKSNH